MGVISGNCGKFVITDSERRVIRSRNAWEGISERVRIP